ncbi:MAG: M48 family metalloprotease [Noviherbaspirillum sp.]
MVTQQDRLHRVAAPLLVNNARLCGNHTRYVLGFTAKNKYSYSTEYVDAAQTALKLDGSLQVMLVLAGSGAERAGLHRGDVLLSMDDRPFPQGERAEGHAASLVAQRDARRTSINLTVARNDKPHALTVPLTRACVFAIEAGHSDKVNAYADGHRVLITRGMMQFADSDDELAYVMAREMAHNVLNHAKQQHMTAAVGGVIDNLTRIRPDMSIMTGMAGIKPMPQRLDIMADRLALYLLARAGYKLDGVVPFWQKMASRYPATALDAYPALHPLNAARVTAMEKTLVKIKAAKAAKKPLVP